MQTAQQTIDQIDAMIDANRRALMNRLHTNFDSSRTWQNAWDRCPDLYARERELFLQRGAAQVMRDQDAEREYRSQQRKARNVERKAAARQQCPTCRAFTLAA